MRVKRGTTKKAKHKKELKKAKGYRQSYSKLYRRAKEANLHAGAYSFAHRRKRGSQMRRQWIKIIAAALANHDISYNAFVHGLTNNKIDLNRKVLAEIAQSSPKHFEQIVKAAK